MEKRILKASPRGFCFGVKNAVHMLEEAIRREKGTVYVRREIVHNTFLIERFKSLGAVFVDEVDEIPKGCAVVFSAHGVSPSVREAAISRGLRVIDATCPLVTKVHEEAIRFRELGYTIILIGEEGHKEVIGITGEAPGNIRVIQSEEDIEGLTVIDASRVAWLSQTTLNADETKKLVERLREKFPLLHDPPRSGICSATRNRQLAVKNIAKECDLFIVVGSVNSSNTKRLAEVASVSGAKKTVHIDSPKELEGIDFSLFLTIGITSGASVDNTQLEGVIAQLRETGYTYEEERAAAVE